MLLDRRLLGFLCLGLMILALGPIARVAGGQTQASIMRIALPPIAGCVSLSGWVAGWSPAFVDPDYSAADSYQCDGYRVHLSVVQYVEQHQGKEAVGDFNSVIPRSWWNATTRGRRVVSDELEVDEYSVDRSPLRLTIWNWYAVGVRPTSSEFVVKASEAVDALILRSRATTNFTVAIEAEPDFDAVDVLKTDASGIWAWFKTVMSANG